MRWRRSPLSLFSPGLRDSRQEHIGRRPEIRPQVARVAELPFCFIQAHEHHERLSPVESGIRTAGIGGEHAVEIPQGRFRAAACQRQQSATEQRPGKVRTPRQRASTGTHGSWVAYGPCGAYITLRAYS